MSAASSANPSPAIVEPLHGGVEATQTGPAALPQGVSIMGGKALLAKKMAASGQSFYSPTDQMVSPCTQKLFQAKSKHYSKGKPLSLNSSFAAQVKPSKLSPSAMSGGFLSPNDAVAATKALNIQVVPSEQQ